MANNHKQKLEQQLWSIANTLREQVFECLDNRPRVLQARTIGERIISKMKHFVEIYVKGMAA